MNVGTSIMVALALGSVSLAWSMRPREYMGARFEDTGELLCPGFTDPTLATSLEVIAWNDETATVDRFAVEQKQGRWVIPSHNDYPADGTERMGKAAASFIDVKKDIYYGDNVADHGKFGVLDPSGSEGQGDEKGQRITLKDSSGAVLVGVIVGKAIPDKAGFFYVRAPGEKRVYGARLQLDISTDFADWIEKDLLKLKRDEIVTMMYDPYSVDERQGRVIDSSPIVAELKDVDGREDWVGAAQVEVPAGKVLDSSKARQIVTAIANLKIVGVRPRPEQLTFAALQSKGFFVTPNGQRLFGNEGEAKVVTRDGVVYNLYFGEITYDSGIALTAGAAAPSGAEDETESQAGAQGDKQGNRYLFVDVGYDPTMDQSAQTPPLAAQEPEGEVPAEGEKTGQDRADALARRFGQWFYVISDSSFKQIHKSRDEMFKDATAAK